MLVEGSCILKAFATHGTPDGNVQMLPDVHQHTIFICMLKFIFATPRAVNLLRKGMHQDCKLRNNYDRQFGR